MIQSKTISGMFLGFIAVIGLIIGIWAVGIQHVQIIHANTSCGSWYNTDCASGWYDHGNWYEYPSDSYSSDWYSSDSGY
jgi:hypothetical protein